MQSVCQDDRPGDMVFLETVKPLKTTAIGGFPGEGKTAAGLKRIDMIYQNEEGDSK